MAKSTARAATERGNGSRQIRTLVSTTRRRSGIVVVEPFRQFLLGQPALFGLGANLIAKALEGLHIHACQPLVIGASTTTAVPLADTISMPFFSPSTS